MRDCDNRREFRPPPTLDEMERLEKERGQHFSFFLEDVPPYTGELIGHFMKLIRLNGKQMYMMTAVTQAHPRQLTCLYILNGGGALSQSDLAEKLYIERASTTTLLQRMEKADLVTRRRDPDNQRNMLVSITPDGQRMLQRVKGSFQGFFSETFGRLTAEESAELTALLKKLCLFHEEALQIHSEGGTV